MEKIKSGLLSNSQQKIDVTNIEGYQNLSVDNFILEFKEIVAYQKNDTTDTRQVKKTYDNEKGILTINKIQSWGYSSNGTGIQKDPYIIN